VRKNPFYGAPTSCYFFVYFYFFLILVILTFYFFIFLFLFFYNFLSIFIFYKKPLCPKLIRKFMKYFFLCKTFLFINAF
jgi:hypothetical protein